MISKLPRIYLIFKICLLPFLFAINVNANDWCYLNPVCGPTKWEGVCHSGRSQSPVDLVTSKATLEGAKHVNMSLDYCRAHTNFNIRNNGHTIEIHLNDEVSSACHAVSGEGFPDDYIFAQAHLHWGPGDQSGTEHSINGKRYALELHIVHLKFDHMKKVIIQGEGNDTLAVIGIVFDVNIFISQGQPRITTAKTISPVPNANTLLLKDSTSGKDNPAIEPIIEILSQVNKTKENAIVQVKGKKIDFLALLPKNRMAFRYYGSLTTPPCSEKVLWTVFETPVEISKRQIGIFRSLLMPNGQPFQVNDRPVQPANNRKLKRFPVDIKCVRHLDEKC